MVSSAIPFQPRTRQGPPARALPSPLPEFLVNYIQHGDAAVAEPFRGITDGGSAVQGLFSLRETGVSTAPILDAARRFLDALGDGRTGALFPIDSDAWRRWSNIHPFAMRHGAMLEGLTEDQRQRALAVVESGLTDAGFRTARDIMRLNESIGEITGRFDEYGEWVYWLSIFGEPSPSEPWGWQIDGHHLIINCLVVGDQVVMTPMFMGSEPVSIDFGKYAGTRVFEAEERAGPAFMRTLTEEQRAMAVLSQDLPPEVFTTAFRDNFELRYEGIRFDQLSSAQQASLLDLIGVYINRMRPGHAGVKMAEVREHLGSTYFAWMGGFDDDSVFYYRVHNPVLLIEFDHQRGIALDNDFPSRQHIHTVVRTPNGNDYGKDLLCQHHERHHAGR